MRLATVLVVGLLLVSNVPVRAQAQDVRDRRQLSSRAAETNQIAAPPGSTVEQYRLNAQYRGTVKKGFSDIGKGYAVFSPGTAGQFAVKLEGSVEDPENHDVYNFFLDMSFQTSNGQIRDGRNKNHYSSNAQDYHDRVEKVVPFIHLVKFTPPPRPDQEPTRVYRYRGSEYRLRYMTAEHNIEATLYEGDTLVGKFFLSREPTTPLAIEKFRVPTEGNVVLSFVRM